MRATWIDRPIQGLDRRFGWFWLTFTACLLVFIAFYIHAQRSSLKGTSAETFDFIKERVSLGQSIEFARKSMQAYGFYCQLAKNEEFYRDVNLGSIPRGRIDFLRCDSGDRGFIVTKRWQVMFVDNADTVTAIGVSVGLTGP